MNEAIGNMLERYECSTRDDCTNALREILQDVALLGLWRSKFFERAAFYGGTALRLLYGSDRYSEDLDFSLLETDETFTLGAYGDALCREISSFGFEVEFEDRKRGQHSAIESAFLKANTYRQLVVIGVGEEMLSDLHPAKNLKIKLEVDTDPPGGFQTETRYVLQPVPFSVRSYTLPDLFAGKLHAVLCRKWKGRVKGRDWYDMVWYAANHPRVHLAHLESRMRQSGDYTDSNPLDPGTLKKMLRAALDELDVGEARREVAPFIRDQEGLDLWSPAFFAEIIGRIVAV